MLKIDPALHGVWALDMPTVGSAPYGNQEAVAGATATVQNMIKLGLKGAFLDVFADPSLASFMLAAADGTSLKIAPQFDLSVQYQAGTPESTMAANLESALRSYKLLSVNHSSAARTLNSNKLVVQFYGTHQLSDLTWRSIRNNVDPYSTDFYWSGPPSSSGAVFWDAQYSWFPVDIARQYLGATYTLAQLSVLTAMVAYTATGMHISLPPDNGARLTRYFEQALSVKSPTVYVVSYDDPAGHDGSAFSGDPVLEAIVAKYCPLIDAIS